MARILVIEDEELSRYTVRQILDRAGHEVEEAENGAEGLDRLGAGTFDLVITDIFMPVMEGIETIREIKRLYPDQKILAMSGGGGTRRWPVRSRLLQPGLFRLRARDQGPGTAVPGRC